MISVARRAELAAALARGDVPFKGDNGVYVGNPKIRLTNKLGHLLQAGYAWIQMGGVNPMRYNGEPILDGDKKYVMRIHWSPDGPLWLPTEDGLRLRGVNC